MLQYSTSTDGIRVHNGLAWRDYNWDGDIVRESEARPGWCIREFGHDHDDEIAAAIAAMVRPLDGDIYIRFGDLPECGQSTNWATKQAEAGISAYETTYDGITGCYRCYGALQGAEIAYLIKEANVYLITGREVGRGSDGEPLLADVRIIAQAEVTPDGYRATMDE